MSYLSLARKYRPRRFVDMVGQEGTTLALTNALRLRREPRSVIFTGVRGVGKTTAARIYAKALNCERGPTPDPCDQCESCLAIQNGSHEDVLEIDGASNTGVDDVRALQETLAYVPQRSSFKVYLIDEVHMLSISAFNALLKTLEEPPEHVAFIFATTELHKVPETIQSRCQTFHLQKIQRPVVVARLQGILDAEKISYEAAALQLIAREGRGSLRDALTLLDQAIAIGGGHVDSETIRHMIGNAESAPVVSLLSALVNRNAAAALETIAWWDQKGLELAVLVEELAKTCRDAFVLRDLKTQGLDVQILELEEKEREQLQEIAKSAAPFDLNRLFRSCVKCLDDLHHADLDRFIVENYVLEWCLDPGLPDLTGLMAAPPSQPESSAAPAIRPTTIEPQLGLKERWKQNQAQAQTLVRSTSVHESSALSDAVLKSKTLEDGASYMTAAAAAEKSAQAVESLARDRVAAPPQVLAQNGAKIVDESQTITELAAEPAAVERLAAEPASLEMSKGRHRLRSPVTSKPLPPPSLAPLPSSQGKSSLRRNQVDALTAAKSETPEDRGSDFASVLPAASSALPESEELIPAARDAAVTDHPRALPMSQEASLQPPRAISDRELFQDHPTSNGHTQSALDGYSPEVPAASAKDSPSVREASEKPQGPHFPATWREFVDAWKKEKPLQARVVEETYVLEYSQERIKLAVDPMSMAGGKLLQLDMRKRFLAQFEQLFGFHGQLDVVPRTDLKSASNPSGAADLGESLLEVKQKERDVARDQLRQRLEEHPLTREVISKFGGTIENIELA